MTLWEVILAGIALSMDAFAVSIIDGMTLNNGVRTRHGICYAFVIALIFGIFQAVMPMTGYALVYLCGLWGKAVYDAIHAADHWAAFALLSFLGGKMIIEGIKDKQDKKKEDGMRNSPCMRLTPWLLFVQAVATSIDALAVGIGLFAVGQGIVRPALIIGITTTIICLPAVYLGKKALPIAGEKASIAGGAVLAAIGVRILVSHLAGGG